MVRGCGIGGIIMAFGADERCRWAVGGSWVQNPVPIADVTHVDGTVSLSTTS